MKLHRKLWMQIHLYLSLFFLPAALIYAITGALYIFEIRQNSGANIIEIKLDSMPQKGEEREFIIKTLQEHQLKVPKDTTLHSMKGNLTMGDIKYGVSLVKDKDGTPIIRTIDRGLYGILMLMHKSTGTKYELGGFKFSFFDFIAIGFGISMLLFYLSGLIMTSFCKGKRKVSFGVLGAGFIITTLAVYLSI
ncbi:hypothetical protein [Helicobacter typhlonius]|uniref:FIG00732228: membrane protein n=2 Tax=Helicobacter typhlonius TaxID=76936 RepID=A0A099UB52_9HELI|nr:hypothetical protein [Helicobacter typhlonius]TLD78851.1 hypothetical protein LS75_003605 [Helicobacter typhlonius]CUU40851.1 FIG00732228: membrane protein [Helicobacter typhlonius]